MGDVAKAKKSLTAPEKIRQMLAHIAGEEGVDLDRSDTADGFRSGTHETGQPCEYSRHYESKAVAAKMLDGSWVGWTYWYGGGKHGEPEAVEWIDDAYDLDVAEVLEPVLKFSRRPEGGAS